MDVFSSHNLLRNLQTMNDVTKRLILLYLFPNYFYLVKWNTSHTFIIKKKKERKTFME